jgi:hypothetical protein
VDSRRRAADEARERALLDLRELRALRWAPRTMRQLLEAWLCEHAEPNCSPKTVERYRQLVAYMDADFRAIAITGEDALLLEKEVHRLCKTGGHVRGTQQPRPLSGKTARAIASILHSAFRAVDRWRFLRFNPADVGQLPRIEHNEKEVLMRDRSRLFLDAAVGHWLHPDSFRPKI